MNPFTESTVAVPLSSVSLLTEPPVTQHRPSIAPFAAFAGARSLPWNAYQPDRLTRRASMVAMLASVGVGLSAQALELNAASLEQLKDLRGVGPRTAQMIVQERNRAGRFESLEDLSDRVRGIGPKRLLSLQAAGLHVSHKEAVRPEPGPERARARSQAAVTPLIEPAPAP